MALPLGGIAKEEFRRLQEELKPWESFLRFQNPQSPHLTLQYWPEVMEIEYHQIVDQANKIAEKSEQFTLKILGASAFGNRGDDRVLFLDVPFSEPLARLKKRCPWPSAEPFSPHITLARIRHSQRFAVEKKKIMKVLKGAEFTMFVDRLRFYAEIDGKKQTVLEEFVL
ncbi:2'-5' RNA ligase family protein [Candidatus Peregrinibacteria bacterium]|nr:2'-5' RNA ligase family protein [Candidatus Peregrinibacteria bacterium]MBI3816534.1 2'-5' RNA ligase family protein [Candidatus Peregrinibacteria bacterium]